MFKSKEFRKENGGLTQVQLAEILGCGQPNIVAIEKGGKDLQEDQYEILFNIYGKEVVDKYIVPDKTYSSIIDNISKQPVLDIRVCAGHGIGLYEDEKEIIEWVNIPRFEGCFGVTVYGDSMYDKYAPGDVIFIREIKNVSEIENGQPYVIVTKEDRFVRLLYTEENNIVLVAYNNIFNPDGRRKYPDKKVEEDDILFLYKVVGKLERTQL